MPRSNELNKIEWIVVENSTQIAALGKNPDMPGELYVQFKSGGVYAYAGTDDGVIERIMNAPSPGSYFAKNIKGVYHYRKLS